MDFHTSWLRSFEVCHRAKVDELREPLRGVAAYACRGGKRLRPLLCLSASVAVDGPRRDEHRGLLATASAIEFVHKASLIQDDLPCMDADEYRNDAPSVHVTFSPQEAVLASDAMIATALGSVAAQPGGPRLTRVLSEAIVAMCEGQCADLGSGASHGANDWIRVCDAKTGALFVAAATLGVLSADNATDQDIRAARRLGLALGRLYQLQDDAIDGDGSVFDAARIKAHALADLVESISGFRHPDAFAWMHRVLRGTEAVATDARVMA